jgi:predicted permease
MTGYLAGRFEALGPETAAALNRLVYLFALPPALFLFTARAPIEKVFNGLSSAPSSVDQLRRSSFHC